MTANSSPPVEPDGQADGTPDAGSDAEPDAGSDAEPDAGSDAEPDAGPDAEPDAGPDGTPDAGPDVGPDAGLDGAGRAADRFAAGALLAGAVRGAALPPGADGERRALAAYREAREAGALASAPRRRDDWRPGRRWAGWPVWAAANSARERGG